MASVPKLPATHSSEPKVVVPEHKTSMSEVLYRITCLGAECPRNHFYPLPLRITAMDAESSFSLYLKKPDGNFMHHVSFDRRSKQALIRDPEQRSVDLNGMFKDFLPLNEARFCDGVKGKSYDFNLVPDDRRIRINDIEKTGMQALVLPVTNCECMKGVIMLQGPRLSDTPNLETDDSLFFDFATISRETVRMVDRHFDPFTLAYKENRFIENSLFLLEKAHASYKMDGKVSGDSDFSVLYFMCPRESVHDVSSIMFRHVRSFLTSPADAEPRTSDAIFSRKNQDPSIADLIILLSGPSGGADAVLDRIIQLSDGVAPGMQRSLTRAASFIPEQCDCLESSAFRTEPAKFVAQLFNELNNAMVRDALMSGF
ncbi:MAG: hypothetical protein ACP5NX_03320 [Candidatus Bilamarchaeaceae archaeon]